ncbi:hypothetical protein EZJ19_15555 [Parasulfuritortus cantonensis]|uniref:DUF6129 domain-containing protein n=1 Tax=Parasulfuritortus cantonensis TaxID=2528202 RepID=A0A4V2NUZ9_9PROT|nr:DUF6129 family protein [Parasulfuritortus cantonensis]TCJ11566.1 hypothetical protein EZJ19_15555 [Parasulfuritortus cantonensis]
MIAEDTLAKVVAQVDSVGLGEATITALRQAWPGVHFTYCSEDEVPARLKPVADGRDFGVYLVSGAEHCVAFTDHLEAATGLVLAARSEED